MITANDIIDMIRKNEIKIDLPTLDHNKPLMDQDFDSLDMASTFFALEECYKIKISEADIDQGKLASINAMVEYVNQNKE
jgi:acyl carrier protein